MWRETVMRKLILGAALILASCGGDEAANNGAVSEETSAEAVGVAADATAIDAATGQAANMAADVNYTLEEEAGNEASSNSAGNASSGNSR
jgi:hypothetical protein